MDRKLNAILILNLPILVAVVGALIGSSGV